MSYYFTELADKDMLAISYYIGLDNPNAARRVAKNILKTCETIAGMPYMGRHPAFVEEHDVLYITVQKYSQYLIFYREGKESVEILRIIHGARDLPITFYNKKT
jgi:toxin ParE1/3/4